MRTEFLGPTLYVRGSWKDPWLNLVPRGEWEVGAGLVKSAFTIGRSEPTTDEETWSPIQVSSGGVYTGSCTVNYTQADVGFKETQYMPELFGLVGPLICQDDLTLNWNSNDFWEKYFQALEKRNVKSIVNRLANIYMNYTPKIVPQGNGTVSYTAGNISTQPPASIVDMTGVPVPACGLSQDVLDDQAVHLIEEGAYDPNNNGWLSLGPDGPVFPILIGVAASNQILLNNAELRQDYNFAFEAAKTMNPVIMRLGAFKIIKNFRHVVTPYPPRWQVVNGALVRVPTWLMDTTSANATKGAVAILNPNYTNPSVASVEGAIVMNPWVYTEEPLRPVNVAPGMKWTAQNYMGDWRFVTGNDALLGFAGCAGIQDPTHKQGRHFAEYRHAAKPIFPTYGRTILYTRCASTIDCVSCS